MYMGMEVEFDFEVPPVEEFSKRICNQVEANIQKCNREERVHRKKRELRERIKMQIVTSPYTLTPRQSMVDSNRRDSMTLPLERRSFTPFQKVPFRKQTVAESRSRHSYLDAESLRSKSGEVMTATTNEKQDIDFRMSFISTSTTKMENQTYASSGESYSTKSSFSAICSPPQRSLSPKLGAEKLTKSMFDKEVPEDDRSDNSIQLTLNSATFVTALEKEQEQHQIDLDAEKTREKIAKDEFWSAIPEGSEYIQAEFFWLVDYRGTDKTFDSDAFTFAGTRFRLTFSPNNLSPPQRGAGSGYSLLLALAQSHGHAYVACEFSVHGLLRPTFRRKCSRNLHFTPRSSVYRGYQHFMGPELLSYLENGTFTFSILMKTYIGPKGELLGLPEPLGGIVRNPKSVDKSNRNRNSNSDSNKNSSVGDDNDDNGSEIASYSCEGVGEEECRMDEIYPKPREDYFYSSGSSLRQNINLNTNTNASAQRGRGITMRSNDRNSAHSLRHSLSHSHSNNHGHGHGQGEDAGLGSGRSNVSSQHHHPNCCHNEEQNQGKNTLQTTYSSSSSSVANSSACFSGLASPSGDLRGNSRRRYFSDTANSVST